MELKKRQSLVKIDETEEMIKKSDVKNKNILKDQY